MWVALKIKPPTPKSLYSFTPNSHQICTLRQHKLYAHAQETILKIIHKVLLTFMCR